MIFEQCTLLGTTTRAVSGGQLPCGDSAPLTSGRYEFITTGSVTRSANPILTVQDSDVFIRLNPSHYLKSSAPFVIDHSNVIFEFVGLADIRASNAMNGITLLGNSNVTFVAVTAESSLKFTPDGANGGGCNAIICNETCGSMDFFNGTYVIETGTSKGTFHVGIGLAAPGKTSVSMDRIALHAGTYRFQSVTGVGIGVGAYTSGGDRVSLRQLIFKNPSVTIVTEHAGIGIHGAWQDSVESIASILIESGVYNLQSTSNAESVGIGIGKMWGGRASIGSLTIQDGDFTIRTVRGAGIGFGCSLSPYGTFQTPFAEIGALRISGGAFDISALNAAGIGGGFSTYSMASTLGELSIENGTFLVVATAGSAIGTGVGQHRIDRLTISAGTFQLSGLAGASGLGTGASRSGVPASIGELLIRGGDFAISAVDAVGIGAGVANNADSTVEQLLIENGTFRLKLSGSTGIGSSSSVFGTSSVHNLTILDGDFQIETNGTAGIGSGVAGSRPEKSFGISIVRNLTIAGGHFLINTTVGAAIGAGDGAIGNSTVGTLRISGGSITATSVDGAAIGGGRSTEGTAIAYFVEISGGDVHAISFGSAAIGGGFCERITVGQSRLEFLSLVGGSVIAEGSVAIGKTETDNLTHLDHWWI